MPNLGGLDISPMILILLIMFIQRIISYYIYPNVILIERILPHARRGLYAARWRHASRCALTPNGGQRCDRRHRDSSQTAAAC